MPGQTLPQILSLTLPSRETQGGLKLAGPVNPGFKMIFNGRLL